MLPWSEDGTGRAAVKGGGSARNGKLYHYLIVVGLVWLGTRPARALYSRPAASGVCPACQGVRGRTMVAVRISEVAERAGLTEAEARRAVATAARARFVVARVDEPVG